jgi:carboxyl-terminal processing protease
MPKRNLAWILVIAMITLLMWQMPQTIAGRDAVYTAFGPLVDVRAQIRKRFVDDIDDEELVDSAVAAGIKAMVDKLHDPYAVYLTQAEYDRFKNRTEGLFGSVGIDVWDAPEGLEVLSRDPGSPAVVAGILPGEIITHIDGRPVAGLPLVEVVNTLLQGPPGSTVRLTIMTPASVSHSVAGGPREVELARTETHLDPIRGWSRGPGGRWRLMLDSQRKIAYLRLTKFSANAASRLDQDIETLLRADMQALILDLRENMGGLLDSAREVADRFLESGLIVRVGGRRTDEKQWFAMRDGTYPMFPMVVLINGTSASAAEIVAGALRDHKRAAVIGERSYGKGCVQEVVELDRQTGALKLTTAYYFLPGGECIHRTRKAVETGKWGVAPSIAVPLTNEQRRNWFDAWREISREPAVAPASEPASADVNDDQSSVRETTAEALLAADPQLEAALSYLRGKLSPQTRPSTESKPGSDL